jgi:hypothetical protein
VHTIWYNAHREGTDCQRYWWRDYTGYVERSGSRVPKMPFFP